MFYELEELLEQDEFILKQRALGREEGRAEGKIEESRELLTEIVRVRFPSLAELAQQKAKRSTELAEIHELIKTISTVSDETAARRVLSSLPAA